MKYYLNADAILRTLWRMFISQKKLLQWNPYSIVSQNRRTIAEVLHHHVVCTIFCSCCIYAYLTIYNPLYIVDRVSCS